jgi:HNH endonuclease
MRDVLRALGLVPSGGNYETVGERIGSLGLNAAHLQRTVLDRSATDAELATLVASSRSLAEILRRLGMEPSGTAYRMLKRRIDALSLDVSHFVGSGWRRGASTAVVPTRPLREFLVDGRLVQTSHLRRRLLDEGVFRHACASCGRERWNDRPIALELDHINGDRRNNRLPNLRLLCPNCHAQTSTYRGRNIRRRARIVGAGPGAGMQTERA